MDISAGGYNLVLVAPGGVTFANTLTLGSAKTLTFQAPGAITGSGATDIVIGGNGTVTFNNITGNIGSAGTPLNTEVEQIGETTGARRIFLANNCDRDADDHGSDYADGFHGEHYFGCEPADGECECEHGG